LGCLAAFKTMATMASHGARASLEYLKMHPGEDQAIHVVM
jgi:hypothetical protein